MRTSNPALGDNTFTRARQMAVGFDDGRMTITGTVNKSFLLIAVLFASAIWSWQQAFPSGWGMGVAPEIPAWYLPAMIGGTIVAFIIIFKPTTAPYLALVYAAAEGLVLGAISALFEARYPGIAFQAVLATAGVFTALLLAYRSGLIPVTENFKLGVVAATGGIAIVYLIDLVLHFFGMNVPFIHDGGPLGIAISVAIVVVASLNLVLDFDFIEQGAANGAPKYMEWYAAFGLLVTLVWLYLEILRLLGKSRK